MLWFFMVLSVAAVYAYIVGVLITGWLDRQALPAAALVAR